MVYKKMINDLLIYNNVMIYVVLILAVFDIFLTHLQFEIDKLKGVLDMSRELNYLPRKLINGKPSWKKAILHSVLNIVIISSVYILLLRYTTLINSVTYLASVFGMLIVINMYHTANLNIVYKNYNNDYYWVLRKRLIESRNK